MPFLLGGLGNFWSTGWGWAFRGALKSRGAKDFDEFFKNVIDKYLKICDAPSDFDAVT